MSDIHRMMEAEAVWMVESTRLIATIARVSRAKRTRPFDH
jgi:hypothetical protein